MAIFCLMYMDTEKTEGKMTKFVKEPRRHLAQRKLCEFLVLRHM